jgi:hypothetical protein
MTDVRNAALAAAIQYYAGSQTGLAGILAAAKTFESYLAGGAVPEEQPKADKPAKAKPPKAEPVKEPEPTGPSIEDVKDKVNELLSANKRKETIDLFTKFKAKNPSTLAESDRAAFIAEADEILLNA